MSPTNNPQMEVAFQYKTATKDLKWHKQQWDLEDLKIMGPLLVAMDRVFWLKFPDGEIWCIGDVRSLSSLLNLFYNRLSRTRNRKEQEPE